MIEVLPSAVVGVSILDSGRGISDNTHPTQAQPTVQGPLASLHVGGKWR
jgi:DNA gyrase/topoisomerase IV subunit B